MICWKMSGDISGWCDQYAEKCQVILVVGVTNTGFMVVEQLTQIVMTVTGVYAVLKVLNSVQN